MAQIAINLAAHPSEELRTPLTNALADAGQTLTGDALAPFMFLIKGDAGTFLAGCKGEIAFQSAHVVELWVHADLRDQGIGRASLQKAEDYARESGFVRIHIEARMKGAVRFTKPADMASLARLSAVRARSATPIWKSASTDITAPSRPDIDAGWGWGGRMAMAQAP